VKPREPYELYQTTLTLADTGAPSSQGCMPELGLALRMLAGKSLSNGRELGYLCKIRKLYCTDLSISLVGAFPQSQEPKERKHVKNTYLYSTSRSIGVSQPCTDHRKNIKGFHKLA